jgi:predicted KAP-like P-loop ATPase
MVLPDNPITDKSQDKFRRSKLAKHVAGLVLDFQGEDSFVVGIEGVWGSGKTSFINLALAEITQPKGIHFVFNPWNFSNEHALLKDFFDAFSEAIEPYIENKSIKETLSKYARKVNNVGIGAYGAQISVGIDNEPESLGSIRTKLNQLLSSCNGKIIVVIDDIDRLDPKETKLIFKIVKLTANFPNTIFLLAYDREKVEKKLNDENDFNGAEYLKKIVQVSFKIPEPDEQDFSQILFSDLDETLKLIYGNADFENDEQKRWDTLYFNGFRKLFRTPRDIKRYISSLRLVWSIVGTKDVDKIDFIAIEAIRVFAADFYDNIALNRAFFTGGWDNNVLDLAIGLDKKDSKEAKLQELLSNVPTNIKRYVEKIAYELFPILEYNTQDNSELRIQKRICSPEKFNFYFQLGIPTGSVSEEELKILLESSEQKELFEQQLSSFTKDGRLRKVLVRLQDYIKSVTEKKAKNIIFCLWNVEAAVKDERKEVFDLENIGDSVMRITHAIITILPSESRAKFLLEIIAETGLFYPIAREVQIITEAINKNPTLLSDIELKQIQEATSSKFKNKLDSGELINDSHLWYVLMYWNNWGGVDTIKKYISDNLKNTEIFGKILKAFVVKVLSTAGDHNKFDKIGFAKVSDIPAVESKIKEIKSAGLETLEPNFKEAINLFENPPSDF